MELRTEDGTILRGVHAAPPGDGPHPVVVLSHGWGAVKEMFLHEVAETLVDAGVACLLYDHRCLGESDGEPRGELDPWTQIAAARSGEEDRPVEAGNDGARWYNAIAGRRLARWTNEVTLRSLERYAEYEPGSYIERVAPTPLLVICMREDTITPTDEILGAYERSREPKRLVLLDGGHYDVYGTGRAAAADAAAAWFAEHLVSA